jgi:hypothetical protein
LRHHALGEPSDFCRKLTGRGIQDHLPKPGIGRQRNRLAIDHHDFRAGWLCGQRADHRCADLPGATHDQDTKCHWNLSLIRAFPDAPSEIESKRSRSPVLLHFADAASVNVVFQIIDDAPYNEHYSDVCFSVSASQQHKKSQGES